MTFYAAPLPPEPGKPVDFSFGPTADIGLVEIFQGDERVATIVSPTVAAPPEFFRFVARNTAVPRAVGYAVNGARVESTATVYVPPPSPAPPPDASAFKEDCVGLVELPASAPGMPACGDAKTSYGIAVTIDNTLAGPVLIYNTNFPPDQCTASAHGSVGAGRTLVYRSYIGGVLQLVDQTSNTTKGELKFTRSGLACEVVVR